MQTPSSVRVMLWVSIALGAFGLATFSGLTRALENADNLPAFGIPAIVAAALMVALMYAGENTKAQLLNWARDRAQEAGHFCAAAKLGAVAFVFFAVISVCLSHEGIAAGERMFLGPIVATLDETVSRRTASLQSAIENETRAARRDAPRIDRLQAEIDAQPRDWRGDRERERLRDRMASIEDGAAERLRPYEIATAAARERLAQARAARAEAPLGFSSLTVTLPFLGSVAFLPWLMAAAIEFVTGFVSWIATPRRAAKREVYLTDLIDMDPKGLELISDGPTIQAICTSARRIATTGDHCIKGRIGCVASEINSKETASR